MKNERRNNLDEQIKVFDTGQVLILSDVHIHLQGLQYLSQNKKVS